MRIFRTGVIRKDRAGAMRRTAAGRAQSERHRSAPASRQNRRRPRTRRAVARESRRGDSYGGGPPKARPHCRRRRPYYVRARPQPGMGHLGVYPPLSTRTPSARIASSHLFQPLRQNFSRRRPCNAATANPALRNKTNSWRRVKRFVLTRPIKAAVPRRQHGVRTIAGERCY